MSATCDTSVLVAALATWHAHHATARDAVHDVTAIPAHVLLETYSVLTRLPADQRLTPSVAAAANEALPWEAVALPPDRQAAIIPQLGDAGIAGGSVYDAQIALTAQLHGLTLLTRDARARRIYDRLEVDYTLL